MNSSETKPTLRPASIDLGRSSCPERVLEELTSVLHRNGVDTGGSITVGDWFPQLVFAVDDRQTLEAKLVPRLVELDLLRRGVVYIEDDGGRDVQVYPPK